MSDKVKEYPILFTGPMVRAILDDKKHMTRRLVKGQALEWLRPGMFSPAFVANPENGMCPYGVEGGRLWVKETFLHATYVSLAESGDHRMGRANLVEYVADGAQPRYLHPGVGGSPYMQKRPSIFMPRWASRIVLEITSVKAERLQDISEEDAIAEGVQAIGVGEIKRAAAWSARQDFANLWDAINAPGSWALNPWVWCISFKVVGGAK